MDEAAILLIDPKFAHNVGGALRACSVFGASTCAWTGTRVPPVEEWPPGARLPREERMKLYQDVTLEHFKSGTDLLKWAQSEWTPVCVELTDNAEDLIDFVHPEGKVVYVFGPEDGGVPKGVRHVCQRFVRIPSASCLNLSAAVNVVLYDRLLKSRLEAYAAWR